MHEKAGISSVRLHIKLELEPCKSGVSPNLFRGPFMCAPPRLRVIVNLTGFSR